MGARRLNLVQRVVAIVAVGAVLAVAVTRMTSGGAVSRELVSPYYPPDAGAFTISVDHPGSHGQVVVWFVLISLWTAFSLFLLRSTSRRPGRTRDANSTNVAG